MRCSSSPLAAWKARVSSRPASSPWEPAEGCRLTCGRPQISLSARSSDHISSSAPWARRGSWAGCRRAWPGQRGDALVDPRVVLHRARAERVDPGVEVEVAAREAVVVADDLGLGDLGQRGGLASAAARLGISSSSGTSGTPGGGDRRGAAARRPSARRSSSRGRAASASRVRGRRRRAAFGAHPAHRRDLSAVARAPRRAARRRPRRAPRRAGRCAARVRRSVIATSSPFSPYSASERDAGGDAALGAAVEDRVDGRVERGSRTRGRPGRRGAPRRPSIDVEPLAGVVRCGGRAARRARPGPRLPSQLR